MKKIKTSVLSLLTLVIFGILPANGAFAQTQSPSAVSNTENSKIKFEIENEFIREVGKTNPRMAIALITLRRLPSLAFREGIINSAPVELTQQDIESHLTVDKNSKEYALQLKNRVNEAFGKGLLPSVYNFSVEKTPVEGGYVLKVQTVEGGSPGESLSTLEVNLKTESAAASKAGEAGEQLKAVSWKIN